MPTKKLEKSLVAVSRSVQTAEPGHIGHGPALLVTRMPLEPFLRGVIDKLSLRDVLSLAAVNKELRRIVVNRRAPFRRVVVRQEDVLAPRLGVDECSEQQRRPRYFEGLRAVAPQIRDLDIDIGLGDRFRGQLEYQLVSILHRLHSMHTLRITTSLISLANGGVPSYVWKALALLPNLVALKVSASATAKVSDKDYAERDFGATFLGLIAPLRVKQLTLNLGLNKVYFLPDKFMLESFPQQIGRNELAQEPLAFLKDFKTDSPWLFGPVYRYCKGLRAIDPTFGQKEGITLGLQRVILDAVSANATVAGGLKKFAFSFDELFEGYFEIVVLAETLPELMVLQLVPPNCEGEGLMVHVPEFPEGYKIGRQVMRRFVQALAGFRHLTTLVSHIDSTAFFGGPWWHDCDSSWLAVHFRRKHFVKELAVACPRLTEVTFCTSAGYLELDDDENPVGGGFDSYDAEPMDITYVVIREAGKIRVKTDCAYPIFFASEDEQVARFSTDLGPIDEDIYAGKRYDLRLKALLDSLENPTRKKEFLALCSGNEYKLMAEYASEFDEVLQFDMDEFAFRNAAMELEDVSLRERHLAEDIDWELLDLTEDEDEFGEEKPEHEKDEKPEDDNDTMSIELGTVAANGDSSGTLSSSPDPYDWPASLKTMPSATKAIFKEIDAKDLLIEEEERRKALNRFPDEADEMKKLDEEVDGLADEVEELEVLYTHIKDREQLVKAVCSKLKVHAGAAKVTKSRVGGSGSGSVPKPIGAPE